MKGYAGRTSMDTFDICPNDQAASPIQCLSLYELLVTHGGRAPDAVAIAAPGRKPLTYGRLLEHIESTVQGLNARGIGRHNRVALVLPNGPELAVAFLATASGATSA